jgi:hypothetical protein
VLELIVWTCLGTLLYRGIVLLTSKDPLAWPELAPGLLWPIAITLILVAWVHDSDPPRPTETEMYEVSGIEPSDPPNR